jgi:peptidylprolyl isomerase
LSGSEVKPKLVNHYGDVLLIQFKEYYIDDNGNETLLNETKEPMAVVIGSPGLHPAVANALMEMTEGETRVITINASDRVGPRDPMNVITVPRNPVEEMGFSPSVGQTIAVGMRVGRIVQVTEDTITVDFNHPLAGKTIFSKVTLVKKLKGDAEKVHAVIKSHFGQYADAVTVKIRKDTIDIYMTPDVLLMPNFQNVLAFVGMALAIAVPKRVAQYHISPRVIQMGGEDTRPPVKVQ